MPKEVFATSKTPALVIYLIDISASMTLPLGKRRRVDVVTNALRETLKQMVFRSTRGALLSPRYRVAMYAYSDKVYDLLPGVQKIDAVAHLGVPELSPALPPTRQRPSWKPRRCCGRNCPACRIARRRWSAT